MLQKLYKWYAKKMLLHQFRYTIEVDKIMEGFATRNILDGGSPEFIEASRKQLITVQNELKGRERLIEYLKSL